MFSEGNGSVSVDTAVAIELAMASMDNGLGQRKLCFSGPGPRLLGWGEP